MCSQNSRREDRPAPQLLKEMIEERKKARLFRDMEKIEKEGEFVQLPG